jgi:hypothetical protein
MRHGQGASRTTEMNQSGSVLLITSIIAVAGASTLPPIAGVCGTAHYFIAFAAAATSWRLLGLGPQLPMSVGLAAIAIANTSLFAIPAIVLHCKRAKLGPRYKFLLGGWLLLFLGSYFLAFPTIDCP